MSFAPLTLPDYHQQSLEVAARFRKIQQRPVVLSVNNLQKTFEHAGNQHVVFDQVSLDIHRREFITIIGPSGCGKSTFIRIAAGLDEATAGEMLLDGQPIGGPGPDRGMVFQGYTLFPWLTVKQNVMFGLEMQGQDKTEAEGQAREWLESKRAPRMWQTPLVFLAAFIKDYLLRLAVLDGWRRFIVAHTAASYAVYKRLRYYEMRRNPESVEEARRQLLKHKLEQ